LEAKTEESQEKKGEDKTFKSHIWRLKPRFKDRAAMELQALNPIFGG